MNILLIEDDPEINSMPETFLTTENYIITAAHDGEEALRKFASGSYSLVLLDLMLPKKNGMEVMKAIRQTSTVPIIILPAKDTDSDNTLGLGLGADDYITKPVSPCQNKTVRLLFSYPISRKKLLLAQISSVWIFYFTSLTLSKLLFHVIIVLTKSYTHISAAMISISFLALPVGLHLKSSKAAIIAGLIIVFGTQGNLGSYTLMYNLPFYGVLLVLAFAAIVLSVYPVEKKDVA